MESNQKECLIDKLSSFDWIISQRNIYLGSLYILKCHAVYAIITKIITYNLCNYEITT